MAKSDRWTKTIAIVGTILLWFPIVAPVLLTLFLYAQERVFLFDYLMPAELFLAVLVGGLLLFWASWRARSRRGLIGWGLGLAVALLFGAQGIAMVTGLASGEAEAFGWAYWLALSAIWAYSIAVVVTAVAGLLLLRDMRTPTLAPGADA